MCCTISPRPMRHWLDDLIRGVSKGAPALAAGDTGGFMNAVALQVNPPRSKADKPAPAAAPAPEPEPMSEPAPDTRSALQKLLGHFSKD